MSPSKPGVYIRERAGRVPIIRGVSTSTAAFIGPSERGPLHTTVKVTSVREFRAHFGDYNPRMEVGYAMHQFFQNGGREAWFVRVGRRAGVADLVGNRRKKTGLYALDHVDSINLLCIPDISHLPESMMRRALASVTSYCERRRCFFLLDSPVGIRSVSGVRSWLQNLGRIRHPNVALYFPRVRIPDPHDRSRIRVVGSSGTVAGVFARTNATRGVWKAPAGTEAQLIGVVGLEQHPGYLDIDSLNALALNCLLALPKDGSVIWGARTLVGADHLGSDWKYVNVRRLYLFIEESIYRGTQWAVFEPNNESLWTSIRASITAFMKRLFRMGAFAGSTTRQAFFVKCDHETTTRDDMSQGIVNFVVGFAPLKPAEFLILKMSHHTASKGEGVRH